MLGISNETFERDVVEHSCRQPVVVEFWRMGCNPCAHLQATLEVCERLYGGRISIVQIDVSEAANRSLVNRFRILGVPQMLVFVGGECMPERLVGSRDESQVRRFIDAAITADVSRRR